MHILKAKQSVAFIRTSTILQQAIRFCYILSIVSISEVNTRKSVILDIPPRLQWGDGHGYCGETSLQAIGKVCSSYLRDIFLIDMLVL
jgi:hypothetical protein